MRRENHTSHRGIDILLMIFFICQPFIDMYKTVRGDTIQIGPFAIEEFFNWAFVGVMLIVTLVQMYRDHDLKAAIKYIVYFAVAAAYLVLHCLNIRQFDQSLLPAAKISVVREAYYIFRVYLVPILLFCLVWQNGMDDRKFAKTIQIVALVISGVIVVTNVLCISFVSYSDNLQTIRGSIFSWFSLDKSMSKADLKLYTSKGWFYSANQLSALMFSLFPVVVKEAIKRPKVRNILLVCLQVVAMIMLGTRTASAGCLLVLGGMLVIAAFLHFTKLERLEKVRILPILLAVLVLGAALKYVSPGTAYRRSEVKSNTAERPVAQESIKDVQSSKTDDNTLAAYLEKYAYNYYINDAYLKIYPVSGDEEFWTEMITRNRTLNIDNRAFKIGIIGRIVERNDNPADKLLGIGYTSNVPYTERDYAYQYYIFGIIGLLLLIGPYVGVFLYCAYKILRRPKKRLTLDICSVGMSMGCMLVVAYFSGHVYGILINMLFLSLYAGKLLRSVQKEEPQD